MSVVEDGGSVEGDVMTVKELKMMKLSLNLFTCASGFIRVNVDMVGWDVIDVVVDG